MSDTQKAKRAAPAKRRSWRFIGKPLWQEQPGGSFARLISGRHVYGALRARGKSIMNDSQGRTFRIRRSGLEEISIAERIIHSLCPKLRKKRPQRAEQT